MKEAKIPWKQMKVEADYKYDGMIHLKTFTGSRYSIMPNQYTYPNFDSLPEGEIIREPYKKYLESGGFDYYLAI